MASAAALITGLKATVFNPAGVDGDTLKRHDASFDGARKWITVYRLENEVLTSLQDSASGAGLIMPDSVGTVYTIKDPKRHFKLIPVYNVYHWLMNHKMGRVLAACQFAPKTSH